MALTLKPSVTATEEERSEYCAKPFAAFVWARSDDHIYLNHVQLPVLSSKLEPHAVGWGTGPESFTAPEAGTVGLLIHHVPNDQVVTVEARERKAEKRQELADVLGRILAITFRASTGGGPMALAGRPPRSLACARQPVTPVVPADAAPLYPTSTRAFVLARMPNTTVDVLVCGAKPCPAAVDDVAVATSAVLQPSGPRWALLAEFAGNLGGRIAEPQFESIGGPVGPETVFELRYPLDIRRHFTASLLIGGLLCDDLLFVGGGPTLLIASGGGALTQWNLRAGVRLTRGVYLLAGGGVRFVPEATDFVEGQRVPVTGAAEAAAAPAKFRTHQGIVGVGSLGLALDLAVLADAGASVLEAMGAK